MPPAAWDAFVHDAESTGTLTFAVPSLQSEELLKAACAALGARVTEIDVRGWDTLETDALIHALAHTPSLRRLSASSWKPYHGWEHKVFDDEDVDTILRRTPASCVLELDVRTNDPHRMLCKPRMRVGYLECIQAPVERVLEALHETPHPPRSLHLVGPYLTDKQVSAVCVAGVSLQGLEFYDCDLDSGALPALTQLLQQSTRIQHLVVDGGEGGLYQPFSGHDLPAFCAALRASALRTFQARFCDLWGSPGGFDVIKACVNHRTLEELSFSSNCTSELPPKMRLKVGQALASLLTSSALKSLDVYWNDLFDSKLDIMGAFFKMLANNNSLVSLDFGLNDLHRMQDWTHIFTALRRCKSLRKVQCRFPSRSLSFTHANSRAFRETIVGPGGLARCVAASGRHVNAPSQRRRRRRRAAPSQSAKRGRSGRCLCLRQHAAACDSHQQSHPER